MGMEVYGPILVGAIFIVIGISMLVSDKKKRSRYTEKATALIKGVRREPGYQGGAKKRGGGIALSISVEYPVKGETVKSEAIILAKSEDDYKAGDNLDILYDATSTRLFIADKNSKSRALTGALVFMLVGAAVLAIGIISFIRKHNAPIL